MACAPGLTDQDPARAFMALIAFIAFMAFIAFIDFMALRNVD